MNALRFSNLPGPGLGILQETEYLLLKYGIKREKVLNRTSSSAARHFLSFRPLDLAFSPLS